MAKINEDGTVTSDIPFSVASYLCFTLAGDLARGNVAATDELVEWVCDLMEPVFKETLPEALPAISKVREAFGLELRA